jgi:hypothetical protein
LRLYHSLIDDEVVDSFISRHTVMDRPELDARNSSEQPPTFEETLANKIQWSGLPSGHSCDPWFARWFSFSHFTFLFRNAWFCHPRLCYSNKLNDVKTKALHVTTTIYL